MNKKVVLGLGLVIVVALLVGGFFLVKDNLLSSKIDEEWGHTYYVYLKDKNKDKENIPNNALLKFIEVKDAEAPVMVINYKFKEKNYTNLYYIEDKKVNAIVYKEPCEVELLYNMTKKEYNYYFKIEKEGEKNYISLLEQIKYSSDGEIKPEYTFYDKNIEVVTDSDGNKVEIGEFDKVFVKVEDKIEEVEYNEDMKAQDLITAIKEAIEEYQELDKIINDEMLDMVHDKESMLKDVLEELEKINIEKIYKALQGVWITDNDIVLDINNCNNKKHFVWGYFASEAVMLGDIKEIKKINSNVYQVVVNDKISSELQEVDIDVSMIGDKKIKLSDYTFRYVAKDMDKAYEILL